MRSTLDELTTELDDLKALVASIGPVNSALSSHQDSIVQKYVLVRRRFDDAAFTVALYASFEKFVENLVGAYVKLESSRLHYHELPKKLTTKHLTGTAEALRSGRLGEGRYAGMSELGAVRNLLECLSGVNPYALNEAVVVAHDLNLRAGQVDAMFAAIGIDGVCEAVRRADALVEWYCAEQSLVSRPPEGVLRPVIEERLKDVVERRNQVTHRGNAINLLGVDAMNTAIAFIEALSRSIFAITVARYLKNHRARAGIALTPRGDPLKNGKVVIVDPPGQRLRRGQPIFVLLDATGARWGRIESMRLDDVEVEVVEAETAAPDGIGLGVDFEVPKRGDLIALADEDAVVWSPLKKRA